MVLKVLEVDYKGFHLVFDEEGKRGWKCVIGDKEFLFPNKQAAESAISEILKDADKAIARCCGTKVKKVDVRKVTRTKEIEKLY